MARPEEIRLTDEEIKKFQAKSRENIKKASINQSTIRRVSKSRRKIKAITKDIVRK